MGAPDIIVLVLLSAVVAAIIFFLIKRRKRGGCASCSYCKECAKRNTHGCDAEKPLNQEKKEDMRGKKRKNYK